MVTLPTALNRYRPRPRQLAIWAEYEPDLAGLDYDTLRADQLDRSVPARVKDRRLGALVRLARDDPDALTELVVCLRPGLGALVRRHARSLGADAWPVTIAVLCHVVPIYPLERHPTWVARGLLRATKKRLVASLRHEDAWAAHTIRLDDEVVCGVGGAVADGPEQNGSVLLDAAVAAGVLKPDVAELLVSTLLDGESLAAAAERLGVAYDAIKKRWQRGKAALRAWLEAEEVADGGTRAGASGQASSHDRQTTETATDPRSRQPQGDTMTSREHHRRLTATERSLRARIAAYQSWARTSDRSARTAPGRKAAMDRYEREVDPDGTLNPAERRRRAEQAMRAHMARLALRSVKARRRDGRHEPHRQRSTDRKGERRG